jgi:hypothetical protein
LAHRKRHLLARPSPRRVLTTRLPHRLVPTTSRLVAVKASPLLRILVVRYRNHTVPVSPLYTVCNRRCPRTTPVKLRIELSPWRWQVGRNALLVYERGKYVHFGSIPTSLPVGRRTSSGGWRPMRCHSIEAALCTIQARTPSSSARSLTGSLFSCSSGSEGGYPGARADSAPLVNMQLLELGDGAQKNLQLSQVPGPTV